MADNRLQQVIDEVSKKVFSIHILGVIFLVVGVVYIVNRLINWLVTKFLRWFLDVSEDETNADKVNRFRRVETSVNIIMATVKLVIVGFGFFVLWRLLIPDNGSAATIGASALFIVLAGATIAPILRDITAGSVMIAERWYGVGDYISVEPFIDMQGVVEQVTLRSTVLRGLSGEVVWIHNQHIQGVKVKYRGTTIIALDVFVKDKQRALKILDRVTSIIPTGAMKVIGGLKVSEVEELSEGMYRIELQGETVPGREWLVEKFAVDAILEADNQEGGDKTIIYGPITRYIDRSAERRFKRSIKR